MSAKRRNLSWTACSCSWGLEEFDMSRRRCFLRCKSKTTLHGLPKDEDVKSQWLKFIFTVTPQQFNPNILLCSRHFSDDCFSNLAEVNAGFAKRLFIKDGGVPTLFGPSCVSGSKPVSMIMYILCTECSKYVVMCFILCYILLAGYLTLLSWNSAAKSMTWTMGKPP